MNTIIYIGEHPKTFDVRWHTHEHWELVYCTGGQGTFRFENGTQIDYRAGELVAIPPREVHANSSEEGFTNIHMTMDEPSFPYRMAFRVTDDLGSLRLAFEQANRYYISDRKRKELVLAALGELITSYIVVLRSNAEFSEPVERIRTSILSNYTRSDYALDEFIRSLPFHYDYLRRLFKKEVGMSPLEYMTGMRMKTAERLLSTMWTNGATIAEIGRMCGFEDSLYFSRVFKKHYGCSPSRYTKRNRTALTNDPGRTEMDEKPDG